MNDIGKLDNDFYETVVIYNMLTDEAYLASVLDFIDTRFFTNKNIGKIVNLITEFFVKNSSPPTITEIKSYLVTDELKQSFKKIVSTFTDIDKNFNKEELYNNTERFLKEKAVYNTLLEVVEDQSSDSDVDTSNILEKFEKACNISLSLDVGLDYFNDVEKHITDLTVLDKTIPSTWPWLDEKLAGGFLENGRALYVFAGETNVGKSIFLGNIATNIASQGKTVLVVSLEMSELVYAKRFSSNITQIPIGHLHVQTDELRSAVKQYKNSHSDARIIIKEFPPNAITSSQLKGFVKKLVNRGIKIDAIVVDYINLLNASVGTNSYERIKHATEQLRAMTYHFNCPIITATQLNRSGYNEINPGLDTVSESIGLAATADCMISIWQEEEDAETNIIRLGMMKNRFGQNFGSIAMNIDYETLTVTELDDSAGDNINNVTASALGTFGHLEA